MTADPADPFREPALTTHPVSVSGAARTATSGSVRRRTPAGYPASAERKRLATGGRRGPCGGDGVTGSSCGLERRAPEEAGCTYPTQYRQPAGDIPDAFEPGDDARDRSSGHRLVQQRLGRRPGAQTFDPAAPAFDLHDGNRLRHVAVASLEGLEQHPLKSPLKGRSWIPLRMDAALPTGPFHRRAHGRAAPHLPELRGDDVDQSGLLRDPDIAPVPLRSRASAGGSALKNRT